MCAIAVHGTDFVVNREVSALFIEACEILGRVVFVVAGSFVGALDEKVVDFLCAREPAREVLSCLGHRITVFLKVCREEVGVGVVDRAASVAAQEIAHFISRTEVGHPHRDAVFLAVDGFHGRKLVVRLEVIDDREVEIIRFGSSAGFDHAGVCADLGLQSSVCVILFVPGEDRAVVLAVSSAVHVDADRAVG